MDPIPLINKAFSLVSHEEMHKNVNSQASSGAIYPVNNMAFAAQSDGVKKTGPDAPKSGNNRGQKKDKPFCTDCNFHGHTIRDVINFMAIPGLQTKSEVAKCCCEPRF